MELSKLISCVNLSQSIHRKREKRGQDMPLGRREFLRTSLLAASGAAWSVGAEDVPTISVTIDTRQGAGPLAHIWEECAGSDRAAITLRESWRQDLDRWRAEAGLKRVRFHGIF